MRAGWVGWWRGRGFEGISNWEAWRSCGREKEMGNGEFVERSWVLLQPFGDAFALHEELEVVAAAGFAVGAAHVEAAEGLHIHQGAGAFSI